MGKSQKETFVEVMFTIESKPIFKFRKSIIEDYQQQKGDFDDNTVIFKCEDGDLHCSSVVLHAMSDFYPEQLAAKKDHGNKPEFTYKYSKKIIASFLDVLHSLKVDLDLASLLLLLQFLRDEGKSDKSEFETALLNILKGELERADLALDTRLIVNYLCNKFDAFAGVMERVNLVLF